jgi:hypothetical protein
MSPVAERIDRFQTAHREDRIIREDCIMAWDPLVRLETRHARTSCRVWFADLWVR